LAVKPGSPVCERRKKAVFEGQKKTKGGVVGDSTYADLRPGIRGTRPGKLTGLKKTRTRLFLERLLSSRRGTGAGKSAESLHCTAYRRGRGSGERGKSNQRGSEEPRVEWCSPCLGGSLETGNMSRLKRVFHHSRERGGKRGKILGGASEELLKGRVGILLPPGKLRP